MARRLDGPNVLSASSQLSAREVVIVTAVIVAWCVIAAIVLL